MYIAGRFACTYIYVRVLYSIAAVTAGVPPALQAQAAVALYQQSKRGSGESLRTTQ